EAAALLVTDRDIVFPAAVAAAVAVPVLQDRQVTNGQRHAASSKFQAPNSKRSQKQNNKIQTTTARDPGLGFAISYLGFGSGCVDHAAAVAHVGHDRREQSAAEPAADHAGPNDAAGNEQYLLQDGVVVVQAVGGDQGAGGQSHAHALL